MTALEKILQEIEEKKEKYLSVLKTEVDPMELTIHREQYKGIRIAEDVNKKHMKDNDAWIPVEDRTPVEEYATVLCVTDKNHYFVGVFNEKFGFRTGDIDAEGKVIAWRPLPKPYKKDGE